MRDSDRSVRKWKPAEDESLDLVPPEIKKMKEAKTLTILNKRAMI